MDEQKEKMNAQSSENNPDAMSVLRSLEEGQIDVAEAERLLSEQVQPTGQPEGPSELRDPISWRSGWLILFAIGFGFAVFGWGVATLGGWWWLCAGPLLFVGITLTVLAVTSMQSPWVHLRVYERSKKHSRKFSISLPIPVRFAAWGLRNFGGYIKGLEKTGVDDILLALDTLEEDLTQGDPIIIDVDDERDGERIQIILG